MKKAKLSIFLILLLLVSNIEAKPRVAVVFVVDQLGTVFHDLSKSFTGGLRTLLDSSTNYKNATMPLAQPTTGPGHACISTGTLPHVHGIIDNYWYTVEGTRVACDEDSSGLSCVITQEGVSKLGRSVTNMEAQGLSDRIMKAHPSNKVFALSLKSRAAIPLAARQGKAFWFDSIRGMFTTSKAYAHALPSWLSTINYQLRSSTGFTQATQWQNFTRTPQANQTLLDASFECLKHELTPQTDQFVLWVSLSPLDLIGHEAGPHGSASKAMIRELDKQLGEFFKQLKSQLNIEPELIVLTSDHGAMPITKKKFKYRRVMMQPLINQLNKHAAKYRIEKVVRAYQETELYLDNDALDTLDAKRAENLLAGLLHIVKRYRGVANAWLANDLHMTKETKFKGYKKLYAEQFYAGRSGDIIIQPRKNVMLTLSKDGTTHTTPYSYDTRVPLLVYRKGVAPLVVKKRVVIPQLTTSLAHWLGVEKPEDASFPVLP